MIELYGLHLFYLLYFSSSFRLFIILLVVAIQVSVASMVLDVKAKPITLGASALVLE